MNDQDIVNKLKSDPRALKSVMQSQDGQALLRMLSGGNSAALGQAARQAACSSGGSRKNCFCIHSCSIWWNR